MEDVCGAIGPPGGSRRLEKTARFFALQSQGEAGKDRAAAEELTYDRDTQEF